MIINQQLDINIPNYIIHVEYEATVNAHDDIEIEYTILGGVSEVEIIRNQYPDISEADFQDKVVELIDKIRLFCSLSAETEYINKLVDKADYSEDR